MAKYRKLIVAVIGLAVILLTDIFNVLPDGTNVEGITETIIAMLTMFGVYQVKNEGT